MAGLDPADWTSLRALGHRMLDDMFDRAGRAGEGPVWQPMPQTARSDVRNAQLPRQGAALPDVYDRFQSLVAPYPTGNTHPGFMGWVHGGGTMPGMLAEMLSAGLNMNCGGRDHAAVEVERTVIGWAAEMVGMPSNSSGVLVTGSSMANFIAVITASRKADPAFRSRGVGAASLVGYAAATAHGCVARAFDLAGFGTDALRIVPTDAQHRMRADVLAEMIDADRAAGLRPFMVVATAGTVDCGAVDDLQALGSVARDHGLWFHVDAAFAALARLSPTYGPLLDGIEKADSLAFDFHKWAQVPYDCGCILVRDAEAHAAAFAQSLDYLTRAERGLAGNAPWFCDFGPDLSRGFRALKVWMTLQHFGADGMAEVVDRSCAVARHIEARVLAEPMLELLAPVTLNIVCFSVRDLDDRQVASLIEDLHESGIAAPSTTRIAGRLAIRAAIVNHRTTDRDADRMLNEVLRLAALRRTVR
jgi:aromatic-L-amino-acid/L-tryptophan decarboxylase